MRDKGKFLGDICCPLTVCLSLASCPPLWDMRILMGLVCTVMSFDPVFEGRGHTHQTMSHLLKSPAPPHTTPQKIWGVECGEASTEDCSLPALHQGLRAPPTGIAAWTRRRRAQQTSSASSYAPSTWHDAWVGQSREEPGAACAPAAAVPCAASSPAGLRRSPMRCSSADVKAQRAPSAGARLSRPPARSRAPGRRCPPA